MWNSDSGGDDVFFDSVDGVEGSVCYDVWLGEPTSVRERREVFLSTMGLGSCQALALLSERRRSNGEADISGDYSDRSWVDEIVSESPASSENCEREEVENRDCVENREEEEEKKNTVSWWRRFAKKMKRNKESKSKSHFVEGGKVKVEQNRKRYIECSSLHAGQEIKAHDGLIWAMKFSPDGQYLASGGADGVVCIWRVISVDGKQKKRIQESDYVVVPENVFRIEEEPLRKFHGHCSDVLDLAWSTTNHLLSSSTDKTVRLWRVESDECLGVFQHNNYVTCVQFNPVDEGYFISGSIDGKVRIWGIERKRVKDWANVRDIVTAVSYQPDGKEFVVGSVSGNCQFYNISGDELVLYAVINIQGKRRSSGNRITGIQFLKNESQRMMITSEDSKIRILDGLEIVRKYKGLTKSGCQMSASFTSSGTHIVSVGEDSRVYMWNYEEEDPSTTIRTTLTKQAKCTRSCESFFSEGVSVVVPWSGNDYCCACRGESPSSRAWDKDRLSIANWFSMDGGAFRGSITWPEEKLPLWDFPPGEGGGCRMCDSGACGGGGSRIESAAWGLVFVTANRDGTIRTFHNYGLPVRV